MRESRSPPPFNEEPQISKDFWGFFVFLHRISRMNRMAILLIGLLTDFRGYLAAGQWLAPEMGSYCFCHADFADDADFFSLIIFLMDLHWFSLVLFFPCHFFFFPVISSFSCHFFISQILDLSVWEDDADFWFHELEKDYADFSNSLFFLFWIHWFLYIINLLIRHFSDPYFFTSFVLFPYFFTSSFL